MNSLDQRAHNYLLYGFFIPIGTGLLLWVLVPFIAHKYPNSGYERLIAIIDTFKTALLILGCTLLNLWILCISKDKARWLLLPGLIPVIACWILSIHLVSDARIGHAGYTNMDLLLKKKRMP